MFSIGYWPCFKIILMLLNLKMRFPEIDLVSVILVCPPLRIPRTSHTLPPSALWQFVGHRLHLVLALWGLFLPRSRALHVKNSLCRDWLDVHQSNFLFLDTWEDDIPRLSLRVSVTPTRYVWVMASGMWSEVIHPTSRSNNEVHCAWWLILCVNRLGWSAQIDGQTLLWMFLWGSFGMASTFKWIDFEWSRLHSIMWVGLIQ